jgi:integrase
MTTPRNRTRSKGEGSISCRKDGKWLGQVTLGRDGNGKKLRRSVVAATKREVLEKLQEMREQKRKGALPATSKLTVATFLDSWLETKRTECARRTVACYSDLVKRHVTPTSLGGVRLQVVSPLHIQSWLSELERRGVPAPTRANARRTICTAFSAALDLGLVASNPVSRIKPPRVVVGKRSWFNADETRRLLAVAATEPPMVHAFVAVLLLTGVRFGEAAGLRWGDIDLAEGTLTVSRSLKEIDGETFTDDPKTEAANRTLALPPATIDALRALAGSTRPHPSSLVFTASNGEPLRRSNALRRVWHPLLKLAQLAPAGFHAARRSHVSALVGAGANLKAVAQRLGHKDAGLTLRVYAQANGDDDRQLADLTGRLLANKGA